jgi:hypothetical protein
MLHFIAQKTRSRSSDSSRAPDPPSRGGSQTRSLRTRPRLSGPRSAGITLCRDYVCRDHGTEPMRTRIPWVIRRAARACSPSSVSLPPKIRGTYSTRVFDSPGSLFAWNPKEGRRVDKCSARRMKKPGHSG